MAYTTTAVLLPYFWCLNVIYNITEERCAVSVTIKGLVAIRASYGVDDVSFDCDGLLFFLLHLARGGSSQKYEWRTRIP